MKSPKIPKKNIPKEYVTKALISFYAFLVVSIFYHVYFAHRLIPGVEIGSLNVGGMTYAQAKQALLNSEKAKAPNLALTFDGQVFTINGSDINLQYNWDAAVSRAYEVGRTGKIWIDTKDKLAGLVKAIYIPAFYDYDQDLFHSKFAQISGEVNQEGSNAAFIIPAPGQLESTEAIEGKEVASDTLFKMVITSFDRLDFSSKELPVKKTDPTVMKADIDPLLERAKKIIYNPLTIVYGKKQWVLTPNQMLDFMSFEKTDATKGNADITIDQPKLQAFAETLAEDVNQSPRGNVTQVDGNKVVSFEITQAGKELDFRSFTNDFNKAYFGLTSTVALTLTEIAGPSDKEHYGIFSLLGEGDSKFYGSSNERIHNLSLAASRTNGVLVPPGGIYSMNNSIGEITAQTGFDTALIIQNGRTVLGEGGGVCQTSTTLFRAVLNAGLPIVMRYPHAYRVHYYEEDSPPGFDASIFQPTLDFQFKNDTPNYVLVTSSADVSKLALSFKIYGTPDGRSVEITQPVVTNQTPPPAAKYIDDPTRPKGVQTQTDWAAWGANVSFNRTVTRDGQVIHKETFSSRYQPWQAIYLVGTK